VSSKPTNNPPERRSSRRFPVLCDARYRVISNGAFEEFGSGKTVNMSSRGVLIVTDCVLSPGLRVEVEVDWPVKLDDGASMKLVIMGRVVRSTKNDVALVGVKILRHAFHTASFWSVAGNS
jgi:hypothetical protein